jgi:hypothetical protein
VLRFNSAQIFADLEQTCLPVIRCMVADLGGISARDLINPLIYPFPRPRSRFIIDDDEQVRFQKN